MVELIYNEILPGFRLWVEVNFAIEDRVFVKFEVSLLWKTNYLWSLEKSDPLWKTSTLGV